MKKKFLFNAFAGNVISDAAVAAANKPNFQLVVRGVYICTNNNNSISMLMSCGGIEPMKIENIYLTPSQALISKYARILIGIKSR